MGILEAIALGFLQGITEFLPVSSSGHLVLAHAALGAEGAYSLAFDAILHVATALAVMTYFFSDITTLINTALRKLGRLPVHERDWTLLKAIMIGTLPAVVLGLLLESSMETLFRNPLLVAGVLVLGSVLFMYAEWVYMQRESINEMTVGKGLKIGLFQSLALIPGMSRSGATIVGGMLMGFSRAEAARFAFLLAIPVMLGAGSKKLLELLTSSEAIPWLAIGVGSATAFFVGLAAIHFMLGFVRRHTLWPFIWYRIILALFVIFVVYFG